MESLLQVGVVTSTHGLKGEVKVYPTTDDPTRFKSLKKVLLQGEETRITGVKFFKQFVILKFEGIDEIDTAQKLKGQGLFVTREDAVPLEQNEYFIADLIGLTVITEDGSVLGTVSDVLTTGANDVYVVKTDSGREVLLPAIRECILEISVEEGRMRVHLMPGLLD